MRKLRLLLSVLVLSTMFLIACGGEKKKEEPAPTEAVTPEPTEVPDPTATPEPTATPKPTVTPMGANLPEGLTLLNTYGTTFEHMGTCVTLNHLTNSNAKTLLKTHYNSITMENEMKPDYILGGKAKLITKEEAQALGYVIPENYADEMVPTLNFYATDRALNFCAENNLGLRGHTLVWHSQTPTWFFRENFDSNGAFVAPEVMDARLEFYVRSVIGYVCEHENGSVLYSWDVVNEYLHAENSGWEAVYGYEGVTPGFVKKAFMFADDVLRQYGVRDEVSLLYNDFGTYSIVVQITKLLSFINEDGAQSYCDGVGMQSHVGPSDPPVIKYKMAVEDFLEAGYEVHITELDVGAKIAMYQDTYYYDLMKALLELKVAGGNIHGITYWGLADMYSWKKENKPLLFTTLTTPKSCYYKVLEAYVDMGLYTEE